MQMFLFEFILNNYGLNVFLTVPNIITFYLFLCRYRFKTNRKIIFHNYTDTNINSWNTFFYRNRIILSNYYIVE